MSKDVEIVIAPLPERSGVEAHGDRDLKSLQSLRKRDFMIQRLADKKMNVLGHYDITQNLEAVVSANEFERIKESIFGVCLSEVSFSAITTEGDKVIVAFILVSLEAQRHEWILSRFEWRKGKTDRARARLPTSGDETARYGAPKFHMWATRPIFSFNYLPGTSVPEFGLAPAYMLNIP